MSKRYPVSRRTLLRGAVAGSAVALPLPLLNCLLDDNGTAMAAGGPLPKRFGLWWWGNGVRLKRWVPSQTGTGYKLSDELQSMAGVQNDITVVSESNCPVEGFAHHSGQAGMLTGDSLDRKGDDSSTFRRKSIDVLISEAWAGQAPFDLVNLAVHRDPRFKKGTPGHVSFNGSSFNPNEPDPGAAYDRLFGGDSPAQMMPQSDGSAEARAKARSRALDAVLQDSASLQAALGQADKIRVERHLDGVRDLQKRIQQLGVAAPPEAMCTKLARPDYNAEPNAVGSIAQKAKIMADIVATAYACDVTRVSTLMHHTWYGVSFPESGYSKEQHNTTHNEGGDQPNIHKTVTFVMSNLAAYFEALKAIPEGDGTLLDNCLIYCASEVAEGKTHSKKRIPIILGGGAGGRLVQGHHMKFPNVSAFRVVMSIFRALEVDVPSFGVNNLKETEPLGELLI